MTATEERKARKKANAALYDQTAGRYFRSLPMATIDAVLSFYGFNETEPAIYCGRDGKATDQVGERTWLHLSWHKMEETGNYEIVVYLS